ncbi:alkaline phosphatase family protein [Rhodospirillaceae bacterium SYSU D60014]|uniref:alkaline phosphatase family protein n=1 Tax=Virgifigura deserti TaxID=2268457 RepID=UPI000E65F06B
MAALRKVLFISADQWRGECLSTLGHPCVRTPHLDALAAEGVLFRRHYTQASPCGPARTSLLTGLYMMNHRSVRNGTPLDARHTNLALEARKGGYEPTLFGYTDTSVDPRGRAPGDPALRTYEGVLPGMAVGLQLPDHMAAWIADLKAKGYSIGGREDVYDPVPDYPGAEGRGASFRPPVFTAEDSETTFVADAVLKFLSVRQDQPWFVHPVFLRPHPPLVAPEPYNNLYDPAAVPMPVRAPSPAAEAAQHPFLAYALEDPPDLGWYCDERIHLPEIEEREMRQIRATYYGLISQVDDQIGRLMAHLKATGEDEHTLVVFTCDHGEMLGDHWLWGKPGYFDPSFHIPLIIRDPRKEADGSRGRVVEDFTEAVDVMPTILDWLGLEVPPHCDGRSLRPFLDGERPTDWRQEVHWEYDFRDPVNQRPETALGLASDQCTLNVIRDRRYKYVHFTALPPLLFDLESDPQELVNLAEDPAYAPVVLAFAQKMLSWRMCHDERTLTGLFLTKDGVVERR